MHYFRATFRKCLTPDEPTPRRRRYDWLETVVVADTHDEATTHAERIASEQHLLLTGIAIVPRVVGIVLAKRTPAIQSIPPHTTIT